MPRRSRATWSIVALQESDFKGYIKRVTRVEYAAPSKLEVHREGRDETYSLTGPGDEEKDWFSRGIARSEPCNKTIVDTACNGFNSPRDRHRAPLSPRVHCGPCAEDRAVVRGARFKADLIYARWMRTRRSR